MNLFLLYYDIVCYIFAVCVFIICFVYFSLYWNTVNGGSVSFESENQLVEITWTIIPTIIVLCLSSLNVNFITSDLDILSNETIKIVGHQWYWSYSNNYGEYDSFVNSDGFSVDKPLQMVRGLTYHLIVTSADVIHSFHIPSLSIKMDAIPGRLNHLFYCPGSCGSFIGYCAELCGVNHSIMPIVVEVVEKDI